jgi:hypothetical protein
VTGRLQELSPRAVVGIMAAGFVLFLLVAWFLLISPKRGEAAVLDQEIETTRQLLAAPLPEPSAVDPDEVSEMLMRAIPDTVEMHVVILDLHRIAGAAGVRLDGITPGAPVAQPTYQQQTITLTLEGSFFAFSDFLRRLRGEAKIAEGQVQGPGRIYAVDSITFSEGQPSFPNLTAALTISTVFAPTAPPVPDAAPASTEDGGAPDDAGAMPTQP